MNRVNSHNDLQQRSRLDNSTRVLNKTPEIKKADNREYEDAIREITKSICINSNDANSYFVRATLKVQIGDIEGARKDFKMSENCHRKINPKYEEYPLL
ncbi:MAG: hypothetical protein ACE1ZQ_08930 [Ignavibacteriaceae bacterium]